jgi:cephalosporin hydroxylase
MKPTYTLEVGFALGGSCLVFTQSHRDLGERPNGQHIAIDPHQRSHWIDEAGLLAVEKSGL